VDCEKFDRVVLDLLYDELDELTSAAARRHMDHCARCRGIGSRLRATREVGVLPLIPAPEGLPARILEAERRARAELGFRQRFGRTVSILAGYAMRPQLAMAALLMLMIGGSLLFLRARPGEHERVHVTERGVPEGENDPVAVVPLPEKLPVTDSARGDRAHGIDDGTRRDRVAEGDQPSGASPELKLEPAPAPAATAGAYDEAMGAYRAHRYDESRQRFDSIAAEGGANAASSALYAALSLKKESGCGAATTRFEDISRKFSGTSEGNEATLQAADCQRSQGRIADARRNFESMTSVDGFSDRARQALAEMEQSMVASRKARVAAPAKAGAAVPPTAAPKKPAASQTLDMK
jgi:hypothetical protein